MMMTTMKEVNMSVKLTPRKKLFVEAAAEMFGNGSVITKDNARIAAEKAGVPVDAVVVDIPFKESFNANTREVVKG